MIDRYVTNKAWSGVKPYRVYGLSEDGKDFVCLKVCDTIEQAAWFLGEFTREEPNRSFMLMAEKWLESQAEG